MQDDGHHALCMPAAGQHLYVVAMLVQQSLHHAALMSGQPEEWGWVFWVFLAESAFEVCKHDILAGACRLWTIRHGNHHSQHNTFVEGDVALVLVTGDGVPACKLLHNIPAGELG